MANGTRLEARITFLTAQVMSVAITAIAGSPFTVTVAAGSYFPSDLLTELAAQLNAATALDGAFTVTASLGSSGTGIVTIAHATQTVTITWTTATELRDVLGFTGTLTPAATSFVGTNHMRGVWLSGAPFNAPRGTDAGHTETDRSEAVGPDGTVTALVRNSRVRLPESVWPVVLRARALTSGETVTGESFETWWLDTHGARYTYFSVAPQVRLYWDADAGTYHTYCLTGRRDTNFDRAGDGAWIGVWTFGITGYQVPS